MIGLDQQDVAQPHLAVEVRSGDGDIRADDADDLCVRSVKILLDLDRVLGGDSPVASRF